MTSVLHEKNAIEKGDLYTTKERVAPEDDSIVSKGKVIDLVLPIVLLIVFCVFSLVYVGGILDGASFVDAFSNTDATVGLPWGAIIALIVTIIYLMARKLVSFKEAMDCIPKGFIAMVPAILILTLATSLKNMTNLLGSDVFVKSIMDGAAGLQNFLPAIIFIVACFISFSTGTSWGTFGILIPIVNTVFDTGTTMQVIGMSACLAGSVCGDHCSPISDTTIMSSAGAQCYHLNHVSTQIPYAITVAAVSFAGYLIAPFIQNWLIILPIMVVVMIAVLFAIKKATAKSVQ